MMTTVPTSAVRMVRRRCRGATRRERIAGVVSPVGSRWPKAGMIEASDSPTRATNPRPAAAVVEPVAADARRQRRPGGSARARTGSSWQASRRWVGARTARSCR